ncbi:MAG: hypothetical protein QM528_07705 [Phycisphaerales bacterium]|nr:hypothetical protein [Phycisphaerales bacterium]
MKTIKNLGSTLDRVNLKSVKGGYFVPPSGGHPPNNYPAPPPPSHCGYRPC